jgi:membrane dipeptidase
MATPALAASPRLADLMAREIVWDNHACMPVRPQDETFLPQLERCRKAGLDAVTLNIGFGEMSIEEHIRVCATMRDWIKRRPDHYVIAGSVEDIRRAKADGKLAVLFDIEGMRAVDDQPSLVRLYYDLGVRWMLIAYNANNKSGGGCQDEDCGLTDLGRQMLDAMADVGMITCCSHTGYRTAAEVIDYCKNPVIFSHSNPLTLWEHRRNIPDDLMQACAAKGGVIGLNGIGVFLGDVKTETIVRAIDYVVTLTGPEHVALGLDYMFDTSEIDELIVKMPQAFPASLGYKPGMSIPMVEPEQIPAIGDGLLSLGYSDANVARILGGNLLRVANQVWK